MKIKIGCKDFAKSSIESKKAGQGDILIAGLWDVECYRQHKLLWKDTAKNTVTTQGLNHLLDSSFHAATQITAWTCAIAEDDFTPATSSTYATPGWTESTAYDEATRPAWDEAAASGGVITNSASKAEFTISATKTIYGMGLVGGGTAATTKGDAAGGGILMNQVQFTGGSKSVEDDDVLKVTCQLTIANS